jgi:hypothetical protein
MSINLSTGDILSVKLIGDDFDQETTDSLKSMLKGVFPDNRVMVFTMPVGSDILFEAIVRPSNDECVGCRDCINKGE